MRLTARQQQVLREALRRRFGGAARLWVFGSRLDAQARGGDHDLMVSTPEADADRLVEARLRFLADLHASPCFEDEKIDVVLHAPALQPEPLPVQRAALAHGVALT
ncbi:MAG TPA: nucleotidyltransferase domain-containing protein [Rubrivivax sp.]|jgi:hypothetical protein|nr:nucleotidyltransferase domain-containing protein [Rubrivivax sp.]